LNRSRALGLLVALGLLAQLAQGAPQTTMEHLYTLTYIFENRGEAPVTLEESYVQIPLFMNNSHQEVRLLEAHPGVKTRVQDPDGNSLAVMDLPLEMGPGRANFTAVFKIKTFGVEPPSFSQREALGVEGIPRRLVERYTQPSETFPCQNPEVLELAREITQSEDAVLDKVLSLVAYIRENVSYLNGEAPRYPLETLGEGAGDCDDQAILLVTLCRSLGVPAYLQVGLVFNRAMGDSGESWGGRLRSEARGVGWHGWAMVYIPPWGWTPIDLTLAGAESELELLKGAHQYGATIAAAFNVSQSPYVGDTRETMERLKGGDLYITIIEEAQQVTNQRLQGARLTLALALALGLVLGYMFYSARRDAGG